MTLKYIHRFAIIGIAFSIASGESQATPPIIGGDTLLRWLQSKDERDGSLAVGYIGGVRELTYQKEHCAGGETKIQDVIGTVRRVLEGMPNLSSMSGSWFITTALKAKWPCKVQKGKAASLSQTLSLSKEKAIPNSTGRQASTITQGAPGLSASPSGHSAPIINTQATESATAERGPTREETEAYIVETLRSCDPGLSSVNLRATQLQYTSNNTFNYAVDLSKLSVSSSSSSIYLSCTSPGCIEINLSGSPVSKHNQTTINCSYTIASQLVRALQYHQTFTGKQKPLF